MNKKIISGIAAMALVLSVAAPMSAAAEQEVDLSKFENGAGLNSNGAVPSNHSFDDGETDDGSDSPDLQLPDTAAPAKEEVKDQETETETETEADFYYVEDENGIFDLVPKKDEKKDTKKDEKKDTKKDEKKPAVLAPTNGSDFDYTQFAGTPADWPTQNYVFAETPVFGPYYYWFYPDSFVPCNKTTVVKKDKDTKKKDTKKKVTKKKTAKKKTCKKPVQQKVETPTFAPVYNPIVYAPVFKPTLNKTYWGWGWRWNRFFYNPILKYIIDPSYGIGGPTKLS